MWLVPRKIYGATWHSPGWRLFICRDQHTVNDKAKARSLTSLKLRVTMVSTLLTRLTAWRLNKLRSLKVDKAEYLPGEALQYTVTVKNNGRLGWMLLLKMRWSWWNHDFERRHGASFWPCFNQISAYRQPVKPIYRMQPVFEDLNETLDIAPQDNIVFSRFW